MRRTRSKGGPLRLAAKAIRSGLRRYPRELALSLTESRAPRHGRLLTPTLPSHSQVASAWLGHASVLLRLHGTSVLTDPVFSTRIGPRIARRTFGLARLDGVGGVRIDPPDVILISHAHFDHLDRPTLRALADAGTTVVTPPRVARLIPRGFTRVIEVEPGETVKIAGLSIRAIAPRHWGARAAWDLHRGFNAYVIEGRGRRVLFGGDTADTAAFDGLGVDLAILGIGAYDPWIHAHANPEQVWAMFTRLGGRHLLPVHHSTFPMGEEPMQEPMERLLAHAGEHARRVIRMVPGEAWTLPRRAG